MKMIDCHQHADWHGRGVNDLIAYMDTVGVDATWALSWESTDGGLEPGYQHISVSATFAAAAAFPDRVIVGAAPDLRRERVLDLIREYHRQGAKVLGEVKLRVITDTPELIQGFRLAGELGMPVLFHLELPRIADGALTQWYLGDIDAVERTLQKCPDTTFIGHGPGWWAHISRDKHGYESSYPAGPVIPGGGVVRLMEKYKNIYSDLSASSGLRAISRDLKFTKQFLRNFSDRILYGTDYWDTRLLDHLRNLALSAETFNKIMHKNALKLVPIQAASKQIVKRISRV
jgi:predicted TIM-barrel fold metal-dependent hydrolase